MKFSKFVVMKIKKDSFLEFVGKFGLIALRKRRVKPEGWLDYSRRSRSFFEEKFLSS
jgi:hypothetical protein